MSKTLPINRSTNIFIIIKMATAKNNLSINMKDMSTEPKSSVNDRIPKIVIENTKFPKSMASKKSKNF